MNKLFVTGHIAETPILKMEQGDIPHLVIMLAVRHKTRSGEVRKEVYRASAWYKTAQWGIGNLAKGGCVAIQGYLTQRTVMEEGMATTSTEIAVEEFLPVMTAANRDASQDTSERDAAEERQSEQ